MENYVSAQLVSFGQSALLGMMAGVVYDMLRAVRLRRRRSRLLTHLLDSVYVAAVLLVLLIFTLRQGQGELRLYMLMAMLLGVVVYFGALSGLLRPVWAFWMDAAAAFAHLLWTPVAFLLGCGKKFQIYIKKLFYFWRRYATIRK